LSGSSLAPDVFWQAAWPLYLEPYNARLVAHRARVLLADIVDRAGPPDGFLGPAGDPGLLVRVGIPLAQLRVRTFQIVYLPDGFHETLVRAGDPTRLPSLDLALAARDEESFVSAESGFAALDYDRMLPLQHQAFQYVRDGRRIVAFEGVRPGTTPCASASARVGLFLLDQRLRIHHETALVPGSEQHRFSFRREMQDGAHVYSLEYLDRACRLAARARYVLTVGGPGRDGISDLALADSILLVEPQRVDGEPLVQPRPGSRIPSGEPIHLYWELYGMDQETPDRRLSIRFEVVNVARRPVPVSALSGLTATGQPRTTLEYETMIPAGRGPVGFGLSLLVRGEDSGVLVARLVVVDPTTGREYRAERPFFLTARG
jgi:hypothetical protein